MNKSLEQQVNKGSDIVFKFYKDYILKKINIKNKRVLLIGIGNTRFISLIKQQAKRVCVIDNNQPFIENFELIDIIQLKKDIVNFLKENKMPKFDVAIMNPPYDGNLHLKILEKVIPTVDLVMNISPIEWLIKTDIGRDLKKYENTVAKYIDNIKFVENFNDVFGTAFDGRVGIYTITKNENKKFDYKNFVWNFIDKNKYEKYKKSELKFPKLISYNEKNNKNNCFVPVKLFANNARTTRYNIVTANSFQYIINGKLPNGKNWKTAIYNSKSLSDNAPDGLLFDNIIEGINFYNSCLTKTYKYIVSIYKITGAVPLNLIPYMGDYTKPWDDKRFCNYFEITGYIDDDHAEPNSEWETILNTMKEKQDAKV